MKRIKNFKLFSEGKAFNANTHHNKREIWDADPKESFRNKVASHIKSQGCNSKRIGNDLEIYFDGTYIAQAMFREDYMAIQKAGNKFPEEFKYDEFGKVKSKLSNIIKEFKK